VNDQYQSKEPIYITFRSMKSMNPIPEKQQISKLFAATSIASLFITGLTQVQSQAAGLTYNYSGQDYTFSQIDEVGTSANLLSQFWYGKPLVADSVTSFIQTNFYGTNGAFAGTTTYVAYGASSTVQGTYGIPSNLVDTASNFGGQASGGLLSTDITLAHAYLIATPTIGTPAPEPFTMIGTLIGGTAAVRMRKKLQSAAE
jgi:hypothetical protein